jgi:hypothetical protein
MNNRAEALASRIEQGAHGLAVYADGLTDKQWGTKVADGRTVGVVVHHVASVYPVELSLAQAIVAGNPVEGVTWDVVNKMNGDHAAEFANVSKADAVDLLMRNSLEASAAVRKFSDDDLDRAMPFGLAYGAPVTAQFVLEDHPVRHSWHHLARIRSALDKSPR